MKQIKEVFKNVNPGYFIRYYILGIVISIALYYGGFYNSFSMVVILGLDLLTFPFSMHLYNELIGLLLGNKVILHNFSILYILYKVLVTIVIFVFSLFVFPISFIVTYIRLRSMK